MTQSGNGGGPTGGPAGFPMYLGPYEAWNFGAGRPYTLPMMQKYWRYISALAELGGKTSPGPAIGAIVQQGGWIPTLWDDGVGLSFIPFVVANPLGTMPTADQLTEILQAGFSNAMIQFRTAAGSASGLMETSASRHILLDRIKDSRFRVAFPIGDGAMRKDAPPKPSRPDWRPDDGLRDRIGKEKTITVVAVIDDGLPFAHRNFRGADGVRTRVEFCWLQSIKIDEKQKSVLFGREYTRDQIEAYIAQYGDDEDALYRNAGATADTEDLGSLIDRHATHGAHVMDLATGYARERGEEPPEETRIIAVQLPNTIAWDTSGFGKDMYMLSAFHYIFDRADMIAKGYDVNNVRLVINFSYGFSGGRHDGETELEAAIEELIEKRRARANDPSPTALVLPAGNTFLDRLRGVIRPSDFVDDAAKFYWRIQPNDRTPCYLELWFAQGFNPVGYIIELRDPWDKPQASIEIQVDLTAVPKGSDPIKLWPVLNNVRQTVGQISVDLHRPDAMPPDENGRWRVLVVLAPTEPEDSDLARAASGKWSVVVRRGRDAARCDEPIHCWIQRSADPESLRSGSRQSYFDDWRDVRYTREGDLAETDSEDALVERFGSLNGLATGSRSLVVAGYRLGAGLGSSLECARPARYSSAGTLEPGWPDKKVDCSSMSDRSRALPGTIAAGVRSGSLSLVEGTSAAAPFVARQLAETFVTASDASVREAEGDNYRSLLCGYSPAREDTDVTSRNDECHCDGEDELTEARLGEVRVPPNWQPGIEGRDCNEGE